MKFPSVCCDASPRITPRTADDASSAPATARTCGITSSAEKRPTTMMVVVIAATQDAIPRLDLGRQRPAGQPPVDQLRHDPDEQRRRRPR